MRPMRSDKTPTGYADAAYTTLMTTMTMGTSARRMPTS